MPYNSKRSHFQISFFFSFLLIRSICRTIQDQVQRENTEHLEIKFRLRDQTLGIGFC